MYLINTLDLLIFMVVFAKKMAVAMLLTGLYIIINIYFI